ncbi:Autophagy- protein 17 [Ciborinia camelliae]|nr:Autophagy- protein 17 [Ciborinia camelliae]
MIVFVNPTMASSPNIPGSQSQASISSTNPPGLTTHELDISLETLVSYLLASKRSLSSISTVWRANEIVTSAKSALEESVILNARTVFVQSGIKEQFEILKKVRHSIELVYNDGQEDFKNVIHTLDAANTRLESTMDVLRSTMVDAAFRPAGEEPRSLLDFVDEQGVEGMRDGLKELIRESKEAQTEFDTSILSFDNDRRSLKSASKYTKGSSSSASPIPKHLDTLEGHAQEMASLLSSLSNHFDLCLSAIRHTDGGYAAFLNAASNLPPGAEPVSVSGVMTTSHDDIHEEPLSEQEREEMFSVLEKDAAEVEDVVMELRDRLNEMEHKHDAILDYVSHLTEQFKDTTNAYKALEGVYERLSGYIMAGQDFRARWEDIKAQIHEQMDELEGMRLFYENYLSSYDGLILEVHRRSIAEEKAKAIAKKAMEQISKLYDVDMKVRHDFKNDVGDYLPVDLYPGINAAAPRWEFKLVEEEESAGSTPLLERKVVEGSSQRDRERHRIENGN